MKTELDEKTICKLYIRTNIGIESLALRYHVGKKRIKQILERNNIQIKQRGGQTNDKCLVVSNLPHTKYENNEEYTYIVVDKLTSFQSKDIKNKSGALTTYIKKQYNIEIPSLYERKQYYMKTGNYWWEQFLTYIKISNNTKKKCPFCGWETNDINNKSGCFEQHLKKCHNYSKSHYIKLYPNEKDFFTTSSLIKNLQYEEDESKFITCQICGQKMSRITTTHLKRHNIKYEDYVLKYGKESMISQESHNKQSKASAIQNKCMSFHKTSNAEREIKEYIESFGIFCKSDRTILNGQELDIFIPSHNIAIEYNGNHYHTEKNGKLKSYHLDKTKQCLSKGVRLLHIFEDEYILHKDIVLSKIQHILHLVNNKPKIYGRKTNIKEISYEESEHFLNNNHIQGSVKSSIYLGAFYNNTLIGVMSFLQEKEKCYNLNRFATIISASCIGVGGKLFNYFIKHYNPIEIKSFLDRRWVFNEKQNLYTNLGFKFVCYTSPDYRYYNSSIHKYKRFHKFGFRKQILHKKYNLPLTMTEWEMCQKLGYERIWDCGLIKYIWKKEEST